MATAPISNSSVAKGSLTAAARATNATVTFDDSPETTLTITETPDLTTVYPNDLLTYTIVITNTGTATATGVSFSDIIDDTHITYTSHTVTGAPTNTLAYTAGTKTLAGSLGDISSTAGSNVVTVKLVVKVA